MATATKKCKVCGKEYEYCHTVRRVAGVFRWQDVACSPTCGSIYLARIKASRAERTGEDDIAAKDADVITASVTNFEDLSDCEDEDNEFDKDFDDEAE